MSFSNSGSPQSPESDDGFFLRIVRGSDMVF